MHYHSMQSQVREKHQQLRREAQIHRQVRESCSQRSVSRPSAILQGANGTVKKVGGYLSSNYDQAGRAIRRLARGAASTAHF